MSDYPHVWWIPSILDDFWLKSFSLLSRASCAFDLHHRQPNPWPNMAVFARLARLIVGFFTIYSTPKVVQVQNRKIAVINRIIQLLIFAYVLGWVHWAKCIWRVAESHKKVCEVLWSESNHQFAPAAATWSSTKRAIKFRQASSQQWLQRLREPPDWTSPRTIHSTIPRSMKANWACTTASGTGRISSIRQK